jgi:hypothetical protein
MDAEFGYDAARGMLNLLDIGFDDELTSRDNRPGDHGAIGPAAHTENQNGAEAQRQEQMSAN